MPFYEIDRFEKVFSTFDGVQENIENMKKNNVFGEIPQKIKTTFQNKIYDKDGKKIDVNKSTSKKLSRTTRRTMGNLRTMSATEGSY